MYTILWDKLNELIAEFGIDEVIDALEKIKLDIELDQPEDEEKVSVKKIFNFEDLLGSTLTNVQVEYDEMIFTLNNGEQYKLYHSQDCCESVIIEDVIGDVKDLVGTPLLMAEEVSSADEPPPDSYESYTWTFYKLATIKGYVTVRWLGTSNGYYSESVDFTQI